MTIKQLILITLFILFFTSVEAKPAELTPHTTHKKAEEIFKNHVFHKEKLIFHINRCKDRAKVEHLYAKCKYNGLHFIKK